MSMQQVASHRRVVVGVDTHKHVHVTVAIDELGAVSDRRSFAAESGGYSQLIDWAESFAEAHLRDRRHRLVWCGRRGIGTPEVVRVGRLRDRRLRGKFDTIDPENAAGAVRSGLAGGPEVA